MIGGRRIIVVLLLAAAPAASAHAAVAPMRPTVVPWGQATDGADLFPRPTAMTSSLTDAPALSAVADDIVGASDMVVVLENDPVEWASFLGAGSEDVLGFVLFRPPPSALYHAILLGPLVQPEWTKWIATGSAVGDESAFATAAMTLVHESFHWRLMSGDESTVNACALEWLPYYLTKDLHVPDTITQVTTESVPVTTTERVPVTKVVVSKRRVEVAGKWVVRTVRRKVTTSVEKTTTTYVNRSVSTVVPNPLFTTLVADSQDFYAHQPPPYNSGSCPIAPPSSSTPPAAPTPSPPPTPAAYHVQACWAQYTGGSWSAVAQSSATTVFAAADVLTRGAANFWNVVQLDRPPAAAIDGVTQTLVEPNGVVFATGPIGEPWATTASRYATSFDWTWSSDKSLFFQRPLTSGTGAWTLRWTFPDGEVCNSVFTVA